MTRLATPLGLGLVGLVIVALWFAMMPARPDVVADLVDALPTADVRPTPASYSVSEATIGGETKRAIVGHEPGRITWPVDLPEEAWLQVSVGMLEPSWTVEGDGSLFMIGISDGSSYHELISLVMDPFGNPGDRTWQDLLLDLSPFAGQRVDVIFNTRSSPPTTPPTNDPTGDMPAWGEPQIVTR